MNFNEEEQKLLSEANVLVETNKTLVGNINELNEEM